MGPKRNQVEEPLRQKASQSTFELGRLHCFNFLTFDVSALQFAREKQLLPSSLGREEEMKRILFAAVAATIVAAVASATRLAEQSKKEIVGLTPDKVRWFTPSYYTDGRQRAKLLGDSSKGSTWIDRAKIPGGARVLAHTHPQDELVTVIEGTWYLGEGTKFDSAKLTGYPAGSFIIIPAGTPHFVAAKEGIVIVQLGGTEKFQTDYLEK
jgi:quercetin dioxygenase-like cupin family protein